MIRFSSLFAAIAPAILSASCALHAAPPGAFTPAGFKSQSYDYEIRALDSSGSLLPEAWRIDNYYRKSATSSALTPKDGAEYTTKFRFDKDGDGTTDVTLPAYTFDLRFAHRNHSGIIWVRTLPLSQQLSETDLRVLMQGYIDDVAGAGYEAVELASKRVVLEKRFAAELLVREEGTIGQKPAYAADVTVANVDQVRVTSGARNWRVKVVIVRPGFTYTLYGDYGNDWANSNGPTVKRARPSVDFPVILIAGVASQPEDFDRALPDFTDLLNRLAVKGQTGVDLHPVATPSPAATATAPAEAPSAPTPSVVTPTAPAEAPSAPTPSAPTPDAAMR